MKTKTLLRYLFSFILAFSSFMFIAKAEYVYTSSYDNGTTISNGESVDLFKINELDGHGYKITEIVGQSTGTFDLSGCTVGSTSCVVKLKSDGGLWLTKAYVQLKLDVSNGKTITFYLDIKDWYPIVVNLGDYQYFNYSTTDWGSDDLVRSNSTTIVSKTRNSIQLPTVSSTDATAKNGLPIKFAGFVRTTYSSTTAMKNTAVPTMPVQAAGACATNYGDDLVPAGKTLDKGTGPTFYVACYEYVNVAFLSLGGGTFVNAGIWTYNDQARIYQTQRSTILPYAADIEYKWGTNVKKTLSYWVSGDGTKKQPGDAIELDGRTWTAVYDYDASGNASYNDKAVYAGQSTDLSLSGVTVSSCSSADTSIVSTQVVDGVCRVTGESVTAADQFVVVTVNYSNSRTETYNFEVWESMTFSDQTVFTPEIKVVAIQEDEETGDNAGLTFSSCGSYTTGTKMVGGTCNLSTCASNGRLAGSDIVISQYWAAGCGSGQMTGLCMDPGYAAPGGATYVRDTTMDPILKQQRFVAMINDLKSGDYAATKEENYPAINTAFRVIMGAIGQSYTGSAASGPIFRTASSYLANHNIDKAIETLFPYNESGADWNKQVCRHYFELFDGASSDPANTDTSSFKVEKEVEFVKSTTSSNAYTLKYTGTITVPDNITLVPGTYYSSPSAISTYHFKTTVNVTGNNGNVYNFEATVDVDNAQIVEVPSTDEEKAAAAVQIDLGGSALSDIFMIKPYDGSNRQRLFFFDEEAHKLTLYLSPSNILDCNQVDSTMLETCDNEIGSGATVDHDNATGTVTNEGKTSVCNYELVKICCSLVNSNQYANVANNVCTNNCSLNTLGEVCDFSTDTTSEKAELFEVKEGYKTVNGSEEKNLGSCTVNVANFAANPDKSAFTKYDGAGNEVNVEAYDDNKYCKVTCREEWDMTTSTFGSYMGVDSVRAGGFFSIDKADIFIRGDRYCYTSYLDNSIGSKYYTEQKAAAIKLVNGYNTYSKAAHEYMDLTEKTINKPTNTYPTTDSISYCKGWEEISLYETVCTGSGDDEVCTDEDRGTDIECTTNTSSREISNSVRTDNMANNVSFPSRINLSMSYDGGDDNGGTTGKYVKYSTADGSSTTYAATPYTNQAATVQCTVTTNNQDGHSDTVKCTVGGSYGSVDFDEDDTKGHNIGDLMKKRIIGPNVKADTVGNDDEGKLFNDYYKAKKNELLASMASGIGIVTEEKTVLYNNASDWYDCENFILYTTNYVSYNIADNDKATANDLSSNFKILGSDGKPVEIQTIFNPKVSYTYDELVYMNLLTQGSDSAQDNILVKNGAKNEAVANNDLESDYALDYEENVTSKLGQSYSATLNLKGGTTTNELNYSKKKSSTYSYTADTTNGWSQNSNEYKKYGTGEGDATGGTANFNNVNDSTYKISLCMLGAIGTNNTEGQVSDYLPVKDGAASSWINGNCYQIALPYYEGVNYIARSVSNSSFFKNKGNWYTGQDATVIHGDNIADAKSNFNSVVSGNKVDNINKWGLLGLKNVFPVSITTPRNLYKYTYTFSNIGSDEGKKAGRLMGNDYSVFQNNTRTCFYEVTETICKCCGDAGTHVVTAETVSDDVTDVFVAKNNLRSTTSDADEIERTTQGQVGFYNTVSSLANLSAINDSGSERSLAANWTDEEVFNYNGYNRYVTNKGSIAAKAIEAVGEEIYSSSYSAEYAYTLTPDAISEIKQNNMSNQYGVIYDSDHVTSYGTVLLALDDSGANIDEQSTEFKVKTVSSGGNVVDDTVKVDDTADAITYSHIGSKFLEDVASKYAKGNSDDGTFKNLDLASYTSNNVCYIEESDVDTASGQTIADLIKDRVENQHCRWVDYIEENAYTESSSSKSTLSNYGSTCDERTDVDCVTKFRLAFK